MSPWEFALDNILSVSSVTQSCMILCDPIDCNTTGFPVHHWLPTLVQTHVHWIGDAIQPSHPLSSPSHPVFNLSQHQGLFQWVSSLHQVAKVLELQLQHQSFQWIFRIAFFENWVVQSPFSPRDSQESFPTPQFKSINSLALSFLYSPTFTPIHDYWKNGSFDSVSQSVQSLSHVSLFATPWTAAHQASLSLTKSGSLPKLMSIESVMPPNLLILCCPLLLPPSIFLSIRVFSNEWVLLMRWPKYWTFSFSISPSNEYSGLVSFRMDWLNLLAVQGTLKSLLQHHSSKAWIFQCSAYFIVQLSHPYMTTRKLDGLLSAK